jgi:hypothetical protein
MPQQNKLIRINWFEGNAKVSGSAGIADDYGFLEVKAVTIHCNDVQ